MTRGAGETIFITLGACAKKHRCFYFLCVFLQFKKKMMFELLRIDVFPIPSPGPENSALDLFNDIEI